MANNIWLKRVLPWMIVPFAMAIAGVANATGETVDTAA